jgi:hypothetical protein
MVISGLTHHGRLADSGSAPVSNGWSRIYRYVLPLNFPVLHFNRVSWVNCLDIRLACPPGLLTVSAVVIEVEVGEVGKMLYDQTRAEA